MPDESKKGKIGGIPYTVILFVLVATVPALVSDQVTRNKIDDATAGLNNNIKVEKKLETLPTVTLTPTATPSATPTGKFYYPNNVPTVKSNPTR